MTKPATNEHQTLCALCGGQCCRTRPGIESPERFLALPDPVAALAELFMQRSWTFETHYGVPYTPGITAPEPDRIIRYPRPTTIAEQSSDSIPPGTSDDCVYLTRTGCMLSFADRPRMCRELEPDSYFECESPWGRREAALAWLPYQSIMQAALAAARPAQEGTPP